MSQGCACKKCRGYVLNDNPDYGYCERCGDALVKEVAKSYASGAEAMRESDADLVECKCHIWETRLEVANKIRLNPLPSAGAAVNKKEK